MAITRTTTAFGLAVLVVMAAGIGYLGRQMYTGAEHDVCQVCQRPIHVHSRTVAVVDGETRESFCCPTCAQTAARQTGRRLEIVELTDYVTGATLDPKDALLVRGSDVNPCMAEHMLMDSERQAVPMDFDRCSPSILAFGDRATAADFVRNHGGFLIHAEDLETR